MVSEGACVDATAGADTAPPKPRLVMSSLVGEPPYVLDPQDLDSQHNPCPEKQGAQLRRLDVDTVVKYGRDVRLAEAEAMHMVAESTTIACPKLVGAYILDDVGYMVMSWEEGEDFDDYWDKSTEQERERLITQLRDYVAQMHRIQGDFIGGIDGSPCRDNVFAWDYGQAGDYGPYASEEAFNEGLCSALDNRCPPLLPSETIDTNTRGYNTVWQKKQIIRSIKGHRVVFSHGDMHMANVKVRADGTVVLLDWGQAGYWPEYWDFYRATYREPWRPDFMRQVERFIPPFYAEAFMMRQIDGWIGP